MSHSTYGQVELNWAEEEKSGHIFPNAVVGKLQDKFSLVLQQWGSRPFVYSPILNAFGANKSHDIEGTTAVAYAG